MARAEKRALIVGTSLLRSEKLQDARRLQITTSYGTVDLLEFRGHILLQRHGLNDYCPPHRINHHAHLLALQQAGIRKVFALGSVGSLHLRHPPGSVVVPDDFYAPTITPTFHQDGQGHHLPHFDPDLRAELLAVLNQPPRLAPVDGGVYWQTTGPRFETPAEIRFHARHVDFVGMTMASECILACELNLPYAAVGIVDNFANGIGAEILTMDRFNKQVTLNADLAWTVLAMLLESS
ncbi:MAG: methylthioadenosine phosphorylase [Magnetococcales bacterium]|nr:methylthioadenosine phosphorylase [Magnetococcales bacterium]HIJ85547.1 MTAP family purine nucleoside phosphorylase [Magnetococcales bacterium]